MHAPLTGTRTLVTGITDEASLALAIALEIRSAGGTVVCAGLGPTPHHPALGERQQRFLEDTWASFRRTVAKSLGEDTSTLALDATLDGSIEDAARALAAEGVDGLVHAIALDRTIRGGRVKPLLEVTREEFMGCMDVSAYSLVAMTRALVAEKALRPGASLVSLSYLGAERVPTHPYKNVGVAKAALERITVELAHELGRSHGARVNCIRFSPFTASKAGGAIPGLQEAVEHCDQRGPLGNARPSDLALEVAHLLRPDVRITGEIRHVDGGYNVMG